VAVLLEGEFRADGSQLDVVGIVYSVSAAAVLIRAILALFSSVNHSAPSGPTVMVAGWLEDVCVYSVIGGGAALIRASRNSARLPRARQVDACKSCDPPAARIILLHAPGAQRLPTGVVVAPRVPGRRVYCRIANEAFIKKDVER
jgi:hypothetical protein